MSTLTENSARTASEKPLQFVCHDCGAKIDIDHMEDPTTSSGACKCCGSGKWNIFDKETRERIA